jgi:protein gp37
MGEITGIAWTDSTMNWWEGCTKVGPGCDHCYAADRDHRYHAGSHWGAGAPRRQMSEHTRNNMMRWQKKAPEFLAEHGRRRRVFCSSLSDIFDNEVPDEWRAEAFADMEAAPDVLIQICTKRVSNIAKMVPDHWKGVGTDEEGLKGLLVWPPNVGVLITVVTPEEIARDVPRLVELKRRFGIPWIGLSIEPMIADVAIALAEIDEMMSYVDWAILGGESGPQARECAIAWIVRGVNACKSLGVSVFVKQMGAKPIYVGGTPLLLCDTSGSDVDEWPVVPGDVLRTREFPPALAA